MDYSDIPSVLAFFRGSPDPSAKDPGRDEVARRIAANGRCWVERTWRRGSFTLAFFPHLFSLSEDRNKAYHRSVLLRRFGITEDVIAYVFRLYLEWARIQSGGDDFDYEAHVRAGGAS